MIKIYKRDEGFDIGIFAGNELPEGYMEVEDSVPDDLRSRKIMWQNGELVPNPKYEEYKAEQELIIAEETRQSRIYELKGLLADTDYAVIKIYEASVLGETELVEELKQEYAEILVQRQAYRDEINLLEQQSKLGQGEE